MKPARIRHTSGRQLVRATDTEPDDGSLAEKGEAEAGEQRLPGDDAGEVQAKLGDQVDGEQREGKATSTGRMARTCSCGEVSLTRQSSSARPLVVGLG